ncbi:MAG: hypothetical protein AAFZ87_09855, partial [Planctomycetota bacterium]
MGARGTDDPRGRGALLAILGIGAAALLAAFAIRSIGPEGAPVPPESPARGDVAHGLEAPRVDGPADGPDAIPRMGAASSAPALPPELTVAAAGLVDLFLVRPDGGPFLGASQGGSGSRTRGRLRDGLSVLVVENGEVSSSYEITAQAGRRLLSDPRWFCSFARPVGAATVEARYGTAVVDAAELAPGQAAVTLTLSEAALDGLACSVVGVAPGTPDEGIELALHPLDVPLPGVGSFDRALVLEPRWSGARFRIDGVPPGRSTRPASIASVPDAPSCAITTPSRITQDCPSSRRPCSRCTSAATARSRSVVSSGAARVSTPCGGNRSGTRSCAPRTAKP